MKDAKETTIMAEQTPLNPGDQAEPGTPGAGEDVCPDCNGSGKLEGSTCPTCGGTGKVVQGIGGG
jgi:RecJ-like exonuclease